MLAIGLARTVAEAGYRTYFTNAADLAARCHRAAIEGRWATTMRFYAGPACLVIDELGYLPLPAEAASALFQVVNQRYLKSSIIMTTNRGVTSWGEILGDTTVAAALLDRLLHRSVVIVSTATPTDSATTTPAPNNSARQQQAAANRYAEHCLQVGNFDEHTRGSSLSVVIVALELGVGLVELRKDPEPSTDSDRWLTARTPPDYQGRNLRLGLRRDLVSTGARVLFVDDWIDSGGQAVAARHIVEAAQATWCGASVIVDALTDARLRRDLAVSSIFRDWDLSPVP